MERQFLLSCESTVDFPFSLAERREIPVLFYSYFADGQEFPDDMGRDPQALPAFYQRLAGGALPSTAQLNEFQYEEFFDGPLQQGDVLHLAFGTGMTGSFFNAQKAAEALREKYPHRQLVVLDSLCSSCGYGLLTLGAADRRDAGASLEETVRWVLDNRQRIHHQFFSTDLKFFRRSGRVSGPAAMLGSVLNICPIMRLDDTGHIIAYDKVRGKHNAIQRTVQCMAEHAEDGERYRGPCCIAHSACPQEAEELRQAVLARFPGLEGAVPVYDIGTIIASHCGPGTTALFFFGDARASFPLDK